MSAFNGHFPGFSTATLELLSQGFERIWHEKRLKADAERKVAVQHRVEAPRAEAGRSREALLSARDPDRR
jgi:hypothetical protein